MVERDYTVADNHYTASNGRNCSWTLEGVVAGIKEDHPLIRVLGSSATDTDGHLLCRPKYDVERGIRPVRGIEGVVRSYGQFLARHTVVVETPHPDLEDRVPALLEAVQTARETATASKERLAMAEITHDAMVHRYAQQAATAQAEQLAPAEQPA